MSVEKSKKSLQVNQVEIGFTKKPITAWGGIASIFGKFLEQIQFKEWAEKSVPVVETSPNSKGIYGKVLGQLLTAISGGTRFSHVTWWGHGKDILEKCFGISWLPQTTSVLTRFWNKINRQSTGEKFHDQSRNLARKIIEEDKILEDSLFFDSTVLTRYGEQEGAEIGYNPKKAGRPSHHPLSAMIGSGYMVNLWNRSGSTHSANNILGFFDQTIASLPQGFKIKTICGDSGFYLIDFIKRLENEGYRYVLAVPISRVLQKEIQNVTNWKPIAEGMEAGEFLFQHADEKWDKKRRYVVIRKNINIRPKSPGKQLELLKNIDEWQHYRFSLFMTNDVTSLPEIIWNEYRPRSNHENAFKDLKEGYGFASFNLHSFWATEAVMVFNALIVFNLVQYLNKNILNVNKPFQQLKTLRHEYLILPAQLGNSGGKSILRLGIRNLNFKSRIIYVLHQIQKITFNCIAFESGLTMY